MTGHVRQGGFRPTRDPGPLPPPRIATGDWAEYDGREHAAWLALALVAGGVAGAIFVFGLRR